MSNNIDFLLQVLCDPSGSHTSASGLDRSIGFSAPDAQQGSFWYNPAVQGTASLRGLNDQLNQAYVVAGLAKERLRNLNDQLMLRLALDRQGACVEVSPNLPMTNAVTFSTDESFLTRLESPDSKPQAAHQNNPEFQYLAATTEEQVFRFLTGSLARHEDMPGLSTAYPCFNGHMRHVEPSFANQHHQSGPADNNSLKTAGHHIGCQAKEQQLPLRGGGGNIRETPSATPKTPPIRYKKGQDCPKRPLSGYNIFFLEERVRILKTLAPKPAGIRKRIRNDRPPPHDKISFHELGRLISQRWRNLSPAEADKYNKKAMADRDRYYKEKLSMVVRF